MRKPFRWLLALAAVLLLGLAIPWAGWRWLEGPAGAQAVSGWVNARLPDSLRDTEVRLEELRLHPLTSLEAERAIWRTRDGRPVLALKELVLTARSGILSFRPVRWEAVAEVEKADLAALDKTLLNGSWKADGLLTGKVRLLGTGGAVDAVEAHLETLKPGGNLNSRVVERLLTMLPILGALRAAGQRGMPASDQLIQQLRLRPVYHFNVGRVDLRTEGDTHILRLFLDGDHLLDFTLRFPKSTREIADLLQHLGR